MKTLKQPTEARPYWWRAKDGDEWEALVKIQKLGGELNCFFIDHPDCEGCMSLRVFSEYYGGEWLPIPRPEQMQECSKTFQTADAVFNPKGTAVYLGDLRDYAKLLGATPDSVSKGGYTCKPVVISPLEVEG